MQFSINNKQSILNTCMIRSLIEVFFFSAGFLALCYFVIKFLQYDQGDAEQLTRPLLVSLEEDHLQSQMVLGHQLSNSLFPVRQQRSELFDVFGPPEVLPLSFTSSQPRMNIQEYTENMACLSKLAAHHCLLENNFSALIAGYLWEDKHLEANFALTRESL